MRGVCYDDVGELETQVIVRTEEVTGIVAEAAVRERAVGLAEWLVERLRWHAEILSSEFELYHAWAIAQGVMPVNEVIWWRTLNAIIGPARVVRRKGRLTRAYAVPSGPEQDVVGDDGLA